MSCCRNRPAFLLWLQTPRVCMAAGVLLLPNWQLLKAKESLMPLTKFYLDFSNFIGWNCNFDRNNFELHENEQLIRMYLSAAITTWLLDETAHLEQIIAFQDRLDREIAIRKAKAGKSFWEMKPIFKSGIPLSLKAALLETCNYPLLTYGAQRWALTLTQLNKIFKTQLAMER